MRWFGRKKKAEETVLPMLSTERLVLRCFDPSDAVDVYAYAQSPKVGPMAGWQPHQSLEDSRKVVQMFIEDGDVWAVVDKSSGHVIGSVGLHRDGARRVEESRNLGYVLGENYWGQGYATEACRQPQTLQEVEPNNHFACCRSAPLTPFARAVPRASGASSAPTSTRAPCSCIPSAPASRTPGRW